jgi:DnaJ-domain-containing protein 1
MNHFARFGLEPRPWIDPEALKEKFLRLSAAVHPDKADRAEKISSEKEFQQLNESYNVLRNTRTRLLHLLDLAGAPKQEHIRQVPPAALELFGTIAAATKNADALIKERAAASSPMLKVQLAERGLKQIEDLQEIQCRIAEQIRAVETSLKQLEWSSPPPEAVLGQLREAAAALGFLERWNAQLHERIGALTF